MGHRLVTLPYGLQDYFCQSGLRRSPQSNAKTSINLLKLSMGVHGGLLKDLDMGGGGEWSGGQGNKCHKPESRARSHRLGFQTVEVRQGYRQDLEIGS